MPICPKCKEVIDYLISVDTAEIVQRFQVIKYRGVFSPEYKDMERNFEGESLYSCPECDGELFNNEDEAEEFLKNEDELQELVREKLNKIKKESD